MNNWFSDGVKLLEKGDAEGALRAFETSLAYAQGDQKADSLYNIAICHCRLGNVDAAAAAIEQALTTDPNLAAEMRLDDDFAPLAQICAFRPYLRVQSGTTSRVAST